MSTPEEEMFIILNSLNQRIFHRPYADEPKNFRDIIIKLNKDRSLKIESLLGENDKDKVPGIEPVLSELRAFYTNTDYTAYTMDEFEIREYDDVFDLNYALIKLYGPDGNKIIKTLSCSIDALNRFMRNQDIGLEITKKLSREEILQKINLLQSQVDELNAQYRFLRNNHNFPNEKPADSEDRIQKVRDLSTQIVELEAEIR
jgi:outer membrane murein-binding lipoprotein Lpp